MLDLSTGSFPQTFQIPSRQTHTVDSDVVEQVVNLKEVVCDMTSKVFKDCVLTKGLY